MPSGVSPVINFRIKANVNGKDEVINLSSSFAELAKASKKVQAATERIKFTEAINACASMGFAMQNLVSSFNTATDGYKSFNAAMHAANTMAGKDAAGFEKLKSQVTELGKTIPMARDQLANGLYQVISNGVPEDNWIGYLEASAKSAVGGIADVGEVVKVTSTIIKNYGLAWDQAQTIQDKIQLTAKNGVTSFEQLAAALPSVTGQAAQLNVSMDEMLAVMATLTGVTGNTSEVSTQLASVLTALTKESTKAQKTAAEIGISFNAASIKAAGGLRNFLIELDASISAYAEKTGQLRESIYSKLFGRAEALRLVNALTGELSDKFQENIELMAQDSAGVIESAFEDMSQTAEAKAQARVNNWANILDAIGASAASLQPKLNFTATLTTTITGLVALNSAVKGVWRSFLGLSSVEKTLNVIGLSSAQASRQVRALATSLNISARSAKILRTTVLSLGAAMSGAMIFGMVTLVSKLYEMIRASRESTEALKEQQRADAERIKGYSDITAASADYAAKERRTVDELYAIVKDETKTRAERNKAIAELNRKYPDFFRNMSIERTHVKQLALEYEKLKDNIIKLAKARAADEKLVSNASRQIQLDDEITAARQDYDKSIEAYNTTKAFHDQNAIDKAAASSNKFSFGAGQMTTAPFVAAELSSEAALKAAKDEMEAKAQAWQALVDEQQALEDSNEKLRQIIEESTSSSGGGGGGGGGGATDTKTDKDAIPDLDEVKNRAVSNIAEYEKKIQDLRKVRQYAAKEDIADIDRLIAETEAALKEFQGIKDTDVVPDLSEVLARDIKNLAEFEQAIEDIDKIIKNASKDDYAAAEAAKAAMQERMEAFKGKSAKTYTLDEVMARERKSLADFSRDITDLNALLERAPLDQVMGLQNAIDKLEAMRDAVKGIVKEAEKAKPMELIQGGWKGIQGGVSGMQSLTEAIDGQGNAWERVSKGIDAAFSIYQSIATILEIVKKAQLLTTAATVVANKEETASYTELAVAKYMAAHAAIPFAGFGIGSGYAAAATAAIVAAGQISKFAEGAIAYGPTLGLFGEYAGARSNPEVVAPLDKLRDLIGDGGGMSKSVELKLRGRDLIGAIEVNTRYNSRTK